MHILRIANFVSPTSGGIKTALRHWGQGYVERGHRVSLIIPEDSTKASVTHEAQGVVYRVPARRIAGTGYSLIFSRLGLSRLMASIEPDSLEVSDRSTLRWTGRWAARQSPRVGSIMISHEVMTGVLTSRTPLPLGRAQNVADVINRRSGRDFDTIACPSAFAAEEFGRIGVDAQVVPLGVDLETFAPHRVPDPRGSRPLQLIHCGRLSREKNPGLSLATVREVRRRGIEVQMTVLGHGPMRETLMREAADLPVTFHHYITDRRELADAMTDADVAIAPGPVETFGLAALEAMACGVPTVCPREGALSEVVGSGGIVAESTPASCADAVLTLAKRPDARRQARAQAEKFTWSASADRMLELHAAIS